MDGYYALYNPVCNTVLKSPKLLFSLSRPAKCTISCFGGVFALFPTFLYSSIFGFATATAAAAAAVATFTPLLLKLWCWLRVSASLVLGL